MANTEGRILTTRDGAILLIQIDRPEKLNGFTPIMIRELGEAYSELERDDALRCAVLHANGKHFTAGLDLPKFREGQRGGEHVFSAQDIDPADIRVSADGKRRSKPVVAAVKGITFTLGIELMLAADIVVAASDCRFSQLEVKRGIMATCGATIRMVERAGWGDAMLYLLTGDEFNAQEALRMGFVQRVVAPGEELGAALAIARRIAEQAPLAVRATRANAWCASREGPEAAIARLGETRRRLALTEDAAEGVRSFVEKRPARFSGR